MLVVWVKFSFSFTRISPPSTDAMSASQSTLTYGENKINMYFFHIIIQNLMYLWLRASINYAHEWLEFAQLHGFGQGFPN